MLLNLIVLILIIVMIWISELPYCRCWPYDEVILRVVVFVAWIFGCVNVVQFVGVYAVLVQACVLALAGFDAG